MTPKVVRSRDNPAYKTLVRLESSAKERRETGRALLEGEKMVAAFRDAGVGEARVVALAESSCEEPAAVALFETVPAASRIILADPLMDRLSQLASASRMVAVIDVPAQPGVGAEVGDGVVLERIQDPGNLGSILRTAAAAGVRDVYLSPGTVAAWSPKVLRSAMGAHFSLRIHEGIDPALVIGRASGKVCAAVVRAPALVYQAQLRGPVLWLFGNEGQGLSAELSHRAEPVGIPMAPGTESLNVAAAVAVCLFEQVRQRTPAQ
jgi:TrmH family RNA methyltransferase